MKVTVACAGAELARGNRAIRKYVLACLGLFLICEPSLGQENETILTFFYLVNQSGSEVKIRVLADGQELFVQQLRAHIAPPPVQQAPPSPPYPAVELKIPIRRDVKQLEVELLHLGTRVAFNIEGFSQVDAGFQIIIWKDKIRLTQDYYPAL